MLGWYKNFELVIFPSIFEIFCYIRTELYVRESDSHLACYIYTLQGNYRLRSRLMARDDVADGFGRNKLTPDGDETTQNSGAQVGRSTLVPSLPYIFRFTFRTGRVAEVGHK